MVISSLLSEFKVYLYGNFYNFCWAPLFGQSYLYVKRWPMCQVPFNHIISKILCKNNGKRSFFLFLRNIRASLIPKYIFHVTSNSNWSYLMWQKMQIQNNPARLFKIIFFFPSLKIFQKIIGKHWENVQVFLNSFHEPIPWLPKLGA